MKILKVVDTREYEEVGDGKWAPIPGSGNARECDRCGRLHEVHAYVETPSGGTMVVGTGCMGLGPDVARRYAAKATTIAKLHAEREHLLEQVVAWETAERAAAAMVPPEPVAATKPWGEGVAVGGEFAVVRTSFSVRPMAEAVAEATRHWREAVVREILGGFANLPAANLPSLRMMVDAVEARLRKAQAT